ncbi:MAG: hypothetical protein M0Q38_02615 [Bacteroidales bacterium]|jgi:hypothetical protein|nr:hypothetical protein [Bacteroidales bacterium]
MLTTREVIFAKIKDKRMIFHSIRLSDFEMDDGTIALSLLSKISDQLIRISESTLRLYVEGNSHLKRGKMPDWLQKSIEFKLTGITKGSTVLSIEAPVLSETLKSIQYPLFNELASKDYSRDTALSLAMLAYQKAISEDRETDLLDKALLGEMLVFKDILGSEKRRIEMNCPSLARKVVLEKSSFDKIRVLESATPEPIKIKLSGKLDMLKHSNSLAEIITSQKRVKVKLPDNIGFDLLKPLFGKEVTVMGLANLNPAGQLVSILLSDIHPINSDDSFFNAIPPVLKETTDIKQLIVAQKYTRVKTTEINMLAEELNITESVEEMINALK